MKFLAEAFAKHILCLFFTTKAFMCLKIWPNPFCAYSCTYFLHPAIKAFDVLIFFVKGFMCYVLNFFEKKSLHVLNWPCAYKN